MNIERVEIIETDNIRELQQKINQSIIYGDKQVADIKYQVWAVPEYPAQYSAMICFEEEE